MNFILYLLLPRLRRLLLYFFPSLAFFSLTAATFSTHPAGQVASIASIERSISTITHTPIPSQTSDSRFLISLRLLRAPQRDGTVFSVSLSLALFSLLDNGSSSQTALPLDELQEAQIGQDGDRGGVGSARVVDFDAAEAKEVEIGIQGEHFGDFLLLLARGQAGPLAAATGDGEIGDGSTKLRIDRVEDFGVDLRG